MKAEDDATKTQQSAAGSNGPSSQATSGKQNQTGGSSNPPTLTKTVRFTLINPNLPIPTPFVPIRPDGIIYASSAEIASEGDSSNQTQAFVNNAQPPTGILFPGNSVKVCLNVSPDNSTLSSGQSSNSPVTPPSDPQTPTASTTTSTQNKPSAHRCTASPISVQRTLIQRAWISAHPTDSSSYVIFGALASDTLNGVSDANKDWAPATSPVPARTNPTMQVSVNDPAAALTQALTAFNQLHRDQRSIAIILAQMNASEAKSLADSLGATSFEKSETKVNLIVSEADPVETTPQATIVVTPPTEDNPQHFIPVISPAPIFQKADCLSRSLDKGDCVAIAQITFENGSMTLENTPAKLGSVHKLQPAFVADSNSTFCDNQRGKITWECRVLMTIKTAFYGPHSNSNPEIVILEARDFDYARGRITPDFDVSAHPMPSAAQESEALWNAGNLTRVTLLGSTLTAILNQNRSNQSQTYQTIASVQQSQQLRILGIFQMGQTYYVNGIPLDSTKLYSVATSDNLATTTSDYASLASVDQNSPEIFWTHHTTLNIADIIYQADQKLNPPLAPAALTQAKLEAPYNGQITPADRKQAAPPLTPFALSLTHSVRTITSKSPLSVFGEQSQLEPLWHVAIPQMSVGFSNSRPSQSDQLIGTNLGGVSNPNVVSPHSDILTAVTDIRVEHYFHRGLCTFCASDAGIDGQFNFTRSIRDLPPQPSRSTQLRASPFRPHQSPTPPTHTSLVLSLSSRRTRSTSGSR